MARRRGRQARTQESSIAALSGISEDNGWRASASARNRQTWPGGPLALLVAGLALLAAAAPASAATRFNGTTTQSQPFVLTMATSGRSVQLQFGYQVACTSGLSFTDAETVNAPAHPTKKGRRVIRVKFEADGTGAIQARTGSGQPVTGNLDIVVTGNIGLGTGRATGRIEPTITLSNGDKCTSGDVPIRWNAIIGAPPPPKSAG